MFWWNILVRFLKVEPDFCFCETGAKLYPMAAEWRGWCYVVEPGQIDRGGRGWVGSDRHLPSSSNADLGKYFHHQAPGTMVMMMFFSYFYNLVIVMMMMLLKMMIRGILLSLSSSLKRWKFCVHITVSTSNRRFHAFEIDVDKMDLIFSWLNPKSLPSSFFAQSTPSLH